ncbi:MAG TPA: hypothetical protein VMB03_14245 [Bryobacteraceae bacterium]|nr:hypothetical protein [Bryobacteraceae bacterium]
MLNSLLPILVVAALFRPVVTEDPTGASQAFAHYLASTRRVQGWGAETIEIEASLPKLKKHGTLRAIRRINSKGEVEFEVLDTAGDAMVRHEVIERYLNAQIAAAGLPPASVAITPANYEFRYRSVVKDGETLAYAFQIKPRKKRVGLMSGELWLDAETGLAIHQSGRLVKSPSFFVKSIGIDRETVFHAGAARMRLTHLSIDTRLVGLADLTVTETPMEVMYANLVP